VNPDFAAAENSISEIKCVATDDMDKIFTVVQQDCDFNCIHEDITMYKSSPYFKDFYQIYLDTIVIPPIGEFILNSFHNESILPV
jgi:hypothetical protein